MRVRWRTVIPLSSALIMIVLTCNIVTHLPSNDVDHDVTRARDRRASKVLPDDDDDDVENKHDVERKRTGAERREKALRLFDEQDDQDADMAVPNVDIAPPDDIRDARQKNVEDARQHRQEEPVDEKVENNDAEVKKKLRDYSKDKNNDDDDGGGQLLMVNVEQNVPDQVASDVGDRNDPVETRNTSRVVLENIRAVGAIVQRLKRQSANDHGAAEVEDGQTLAPVNPHPFRYVINCPQLCSDVERLFLVVYVHTAIEHHKRRTVIRRTWGDVSQYDVTVRIVFVMGVHAGALDTQTALAFEAERYEDIVQVIF